MIRFRIGLFLVGLFSATPSLAAPPPVEDYGKLPGIEFVEMSPGGTRYAFIATIGENRRLYVASTDGKVLQLVNVGTTKVHSLEWAGDDHVLAKLSATTVLGPYYTTWQTELWGVTVLN